MTNEILKYVLNKKLLLLTFPISILIGLASAIFLITLDWATQTRLESAFLLFLLPLGGIIITYLYNNLGGDSSKGNKLIFENFHNSNGKIDWILAPFVFIGTIITHLFGGSAGREGTAIQMGTSIASQFTNLFSEDFIIKRILILMGISGGFAAVFGTPWAGIIFSIEMFRSWKMVKFAFLPIILTAFFADWVCTAIGATHTNYLLDTAFTFNFKNYSIIIISSIGFGLVARLFVISNNYSHHLFSRIINPYSRIVFGSIIIIIIAISFDFRQYLGLGIETLVFSFSGQILVYGFLIKIILTSITLGSGFKGGEVTPLFFIGAAFANSLSQFLPVEQSLLVSCGFVAVFAGATNTPLACAVMAMELFGFQNWQFFIIACFIAYAFSGKSTIYNFKLK